jgi:hypothetical protein
MRLPSSYYLDESDPDVLVLRRQDGTVIAVFSAQGATTEGIVEAAKEDYAALLRVRTRTVGRRAEDGAKGRTPRALEGEVRGEPALAPARAAREPPLASAS